MRTIRIYLPCQPHYIMSSAKLILEFQSLTTSHQDHVGELYNHHHHWLYGWLYKKLGCSYKAEDLSHDTFIKLLKKQDQEPLREPRAYLTTIAYSLVKNHWRRRDIEKSYLDTLSAMPEAETLSVEEHAIVLETLMQIDSALKDLPARVKETFLLSQLDGLTYKNIALHLDVSERTIKKYMARAMLHCLLVADTEP